MACFTGINVFMFHVQQRMQGAVEFLINTHLSTNLPVKKPF